MALQVENSQVENSDGLQFLEILGEGIETFGNVMANRIEKNTTIQAKAREVFSSADDNEVALAGYGLQDERERAADDKSPGRSLVRIRDAGTT